jgi:hypothetical protein
MVGKYLIIKCTSAGRRFRKNSVSFNVGRPKVVGAQTTSSCLFFHSFSPSRPKKKVLKKISFQGPKNQPQKSPGGGEIFSLANIQVTTYIV